MAHSGQSAYHQRCCSARAHPSPRLTRSCPSRPPCPRPWPWRRAASTGAASRARRPPWSCPRAPARPDGGRAEARERMSRGRASCRRARLRGARRRGSRSWGEGGVRARLELGLDGGGRGAPRELLERLLRVRLGLERLHLILHALEGGDGGGGAHLAQHVVHLGRRLGRARARNVPRGRESEAAGAKCSRESRAQCSAGS